MQKTLIVIFLLLLLALAGFVYSGSRRAKNSSMGDKKVIMDTDREKTNSSGKNFDSDKMALESPAFDNGEDIPSKFTCQGENANPELVFKSIPENATSLALIMEDPDSPGGVWDHWVVFNIMPYVQGIEEDSVPSGAIEGINSFGEVGYGGPCPGSGKHRYEFNLYALDVKLSLLSGAQKSEVLAQMEGHVLGHAKLTGLYEKTPQ